MWRAIKYRRLLCGKPYLLPSLCKWIFKRYDTTYYLFTFKLIYLALSTLFLFHPTPSSIPVARSAGYGTVRNHGIFFVPRTFTHVHVPDIGENNAKCFQTPSVSSMLKEGLVGFKNISRNSRYILVCTRETVGAANSVKANYTGYFGIRRI